MTNITPPKPQHVWRGIYLGFVYKICHWGDSELNEGRGVWNYYIFFYEPKIVDFEKLWLPPKLIKITLKSSGFVSYDYYNTSVANVDWHGGVTYYAKHGELPGYRGVEFGCDYSHLRDHECDFDYTLEDVLQDVAHTITELQFLRVIPDHEKD